MFLCVAVGFCGFLLIFMFFVRSFIGFCGFL